MTTVFFCKEGTSILGITFLLLLLLFSSSIRAQKTEYFINGGADPATEWNPNVEEINSFKFKVKLPEVSYDYDMVKVDFLLLSGNKERSVALFADEVQWYSPLQLKTLFPEGILTGYILDENGRGLNGIRKHRVLKNYQDEGTFYLAVKGYQQVGVKDYYNESLKVWEQVKVYDDGTLLNEKTLIDLVQMEGWEARKKAKEDAGKAEQKRFKRGKLFYYLGAAALVGVVAVVRGTR